GTCRLCECRCHAAGLVEAPLPGRFAALPTPGRTDAGRVPPADADCRSDDLRLSQCDRHDQLWHLRSGPCRLGISRPAELARCLRLRRHPARRLAHAPDVKPVSFAPSAAYGAHAHTGDIDHYRLRRLRQSPACTNETIYLAVSVGDPDGNDRTLLDAR